MRACPSCAAENADRAKFCADCGKKLLEPLSTREVRKTVTVLFADVVGSTELGERLDPEAVRSLMASYFALARAIIERHGGSVEKFIGDAVMAVFGVPTVHEDDALRGVRAAADLRDAVGRLGGGLAIRVGVNTGGVIAGDPGGAQTFVTGDAVNVAARLQVAGSAGQVLLGPATVVLVRDAVSLGPPELLSLRGKATPIEAWPLVAVLGTEGRLRRPDPPLVGREQELAALETAWRTVTTERSPQLLTLLAPAGVGKSRLTTELVARRADDVRVLVGHCLSYGERVTYWPIRELVHGAAQITDLDEPEAARAKVGALLMGERDADVLGRRVASAIGLSVEPASQDELFWAIRRLIETLARRRPLLVVLEDLHWAEPTLLDLVEYVVDLATDVPLLVLATARPELLEDRPGWGSGRANALVLRLEPLGRGASGTLLENLPGGASIPDGLRRRILEAAEGTPLYVEEFVGLLRDTGHLLRTADGRWQAVRDLDALDVPPTVQALLAARLDRLPAPERTLAGRASVAGRTFESAMLAEIDPLLSKDLGRLLLSLVRKELLRPDRAELTAGDAFRFRHILIRDAAYAALPKADRGQLHERLADWLERVAGERVTEYEEILGYHLEQAYRYRSELGDRGEELERQSLDRMARRASGHLTRAGLRARGLGDHSVSIAMLERSRALLPSDSPDRPELTLELAASVAEVGRFARAEELIAEATAGARLGANSRIAAHAQLLLQTAVRFPTDPEFSRAQMRAEAMAAIELFGGMGDARGLARAWQAVGDADFDIGSAALAVEAWNRAIENASKGGDEELVLRLTTSIAKGMSFGSTHRTEAEQGWNDILTTTANPRVRALAFAGLGRLHAMAGRFEDARRARSDGRLVIEELGRTIDLVGETSHDSAAVETLAGDPHGAERELRAGYEILDAAGEAGYLSSSAALLVHALVDQGKLDEALRFSKISEEISAADDFYSQVVWRSGRAKVLARSARIDEALELARDSVSRAAATDWLDTHANAFMDLAEVMVLAGLTGDAQAAANEALVLYERKGVDVSAARARALITKLALA